MSKRLGFQLTGIAVALALASGSFPGIAISAASPDASSARGGVNGVGQGKDGVGQGKGGVGHGKGGVGHGKGGVGHGPWSSPATSCEHPYPCGGEWPDGLEGPFELDEVLHVRLPVPADYDDPSAGTIELEGWVGLPDLPDDVQAPVALVMTPYIGHEAEGTPTQDRFWSDTPRAGVIRNWGVLPIDLVRNGYAAAFFSVRGYGNSGGCPGALRRAAQLDAGLIVDWAATQPWSNGRVGMGGISARSAAPIHAARQQLEPLKTIVVAGTTFDGYAMYFTPQGAFRVMDDNTFGPTANLPAREGDTEDRLGRLDVAPERASCTNWDQWLAPTRNFLSDDRNEEFWMERSSFPDLPNVTASILLAQGFKDWRQHAFQADWIWSLTPNAPKRQLTGQLDHNWPWPHLIDFDPSWEQTNWEDTLFAWLDYWLKGQGTPPRLGVADYQDGHGTWHSSSSWPPAEARDEVLYLAANELVGAPRPGDEVARPLPLPHDERRTTEWHDFFWKPWVSMCPDPVTSATSTHGVLYVSEPFAEDTLIAGNPFVYLKLSSDQPGGTVRVQVAEIVGGNTDCNLLQEPSNIRALSAGAADLRFHDGNFVGADFPVDRPAHIRIDLLYMAETIQAGSRLVIGITGANPYDEWTGQPHYQPELTVHAGTVDASQIVLPVVRGSTGGSAPEALYPPRPFLPVL